MLFAFLGRVEYSVSLFYHLSNMLMDTTKKFKSIPADPCPLSRRVGVDDGMVAKCRIDKGEYFINQSRAEGG